MAEFTLDTSGEVEIPATIAMTGEPDNIQLSYRWPDLDAFTKGYVEALFASLRRWHPDRDPVLPVPAPEGAGSVVMGVGFSDLAPGTLAGILKDCAAHEKAYPLQAHDPRRHSRGRNFWRNRQAGMWESSGWPPLTAYLGDDGKVYLREAR